MIHADSKVFVIICRYGIQIADSPTIIADYNSAKINSIDKAITSGLQTEFYMENLRRFENINDYNVFNNNRTLHPLVSVIDFSKAAPRTGSAMYFGFYAILLKDVICGDMVYGRHTYDYQEGTLVFLSPGQTAGVNSNGDVYQPKGYGLVFHADLIHGTPLGKHIQDYTFFSYQSNESLHLSDRERKLVFDCFEKIEYELEHAIDKHSKQLIASNIELFLNYCLRFYDRQFITRDVAHKSILQRFEILLREFFESDKPQTIGLPSVAWCATELNLSAGYFGDLIKKDTGITAQEYIQIKVIDLAKEKIFDRSKSVNEIAFELGFKYPQHFTRLFKQRVGQSPSEYRSAN